MQDFSTEFLHGKKPKRVHGTMSTHCGLCQLMSQENGPEHTAAKGSMHVVQET